MSATMIKVTNRGHIARHCGEYLLMPNIPVEVPMDFIRKFGVSRELHYDFSGAAEKMRTHTDSGSLRIDWRSPLSMVDGYGRHAIWLIRALQRAGVVVAVRDVGWVDNAWLPADIKQARAQYHYDVPSKIGVAFTLGYDPQLYDHESLIKIGITQFETDTLPRVHAANVNRLDHCVVTSSFQVNVFRRSGVKVPISVMRPGIEVADFPYMERPKDGKFKVLILGALTDRKNPLGAIRIFQAASKNNPDWRLTIKTRRATGVERIRKVAASDSRIEVLVRDDPPETVNEFYQSHDCFLWPTKGEGVGLPPLEAMSTGMELVCCDNSGMSDYLSSEWCYPFRTSGMEDAHGPGLFTDQYVRMHGEVGRWWSPDEAHAAKQLERCFNEWRADRGRGDKAAKAVREKFTIDHSAADLIKVVERYV